MVEQRFEELVVANEGLERLVCRPIAKGNGFTCRVSGWSMFPAITNAGLIRVEAADIAALKPGDIVLAKTGAQKLVVHRIIKKINIACGRRFILRGDNQTGCGERVADRNIFGKITAVGSKDKLVSIVGGSGKLRNYLCFRLAFLSREILPSAVKILIFLQGLKLYRRLGRKYLKPSVFTVDRLEENSYFLYTRYGCMVAASANVSCDTPRMVGCRWQVSNFRVALRFRGLGLGSRMLDEICRLVLLRNGAGLKLLVDDTNKPALNFYFSRGFRRINTVCQQPNSGKIVLEKVLV